MAFRASGLLRAFKAMPSKWQREYEPADGEKNEDSNIARTHQKRQLVMLNWHRKLDGAVPNQSLANMLHDSQEPKPVHQREVLAIGGFSFQ